ncbi:hypothetical protein OSTOST_14261 [Ostertagia ostertagi]
MDFLHANTNAKLINLATNAGSISLFLLKGKIIWAIALPMAHHRTPLMVFRKRMHMTPEFSCIKIKLQLNNGFRKLKVNNNP